MVALKILDMIYIQKLPKIRGNTLLQPLMDHPQHFIWMDPMPVPSMILQVITFMQWEITKGATSVLPNIWMTSAFMA